MDTKYPFAGRDKVQHFMIGLILAVLLHRFGSLTTLVIVLGLSIVWEIVELVRYILWRKAVEKDPNIPWPFAADQFSWRDILATVVGALTVFLM